MPEIYNQTWGGRTDRRISGKIANLDEEKATAADNRVGEISKGK